MSEKVPMHVIRADMYMGIGQAIQELQRAQAELLRFGRSEEAQLANGTDILQGVIDYFNSGALYRFRDLCTPSKEPPTQEQTDE